MRKIWVIDDDSIFCDIFRMMVDQLGLEADISTYHDGAVFLQSLTHAAPKEYPNAILLDITMPGQDGWETLDALRDFHQAKNSKATYQIYMVTSSVSESDQRKAEKYPELKGYAIKPLTPEFVKEVVAS